MADKSSLDADKGSVGGAFHADGKVGEKAQQVGGPFDKEGGLSAPIPSPIYITLTSMAAVGKQFTSGGAVGGTAQSAAEQMQGEKKSLFDKDGTVGKQFQAEGSIGSVGEAVGGPFSKEGGEFVPLRGLPYAHIYASNR